MKVKLGIYVCPCGRRFEAPLLDDFGYGEFLLWSSGGEVAYLNAIENSVYAEVRAIVKAQLPRSIEDEVPYLKRIFGTVACDRATDGSPFEMDTRPRCIAGGALPISWDHVRPIRDTEVPSVAHLKWQSYSDQKKVAVIRDSLQEYAKISSTE